MTAAPQPQGSSASDMLSQIRQIIAEDTPGGAPSDNAKEAAEDAAWIAAERNHPAEPTAEGGSDDRLFARLAALGARLDHIEEPAEGSCQNSSERLVLGADELHEPAVAEDEPSAEIGPSEEFAGAAPLETALPTPAGIMSSVNEVPDPETEVKASVEQPSVDTANAQNCASEKLEAPAEHPDCSAYTPSPDTAPEAESPTADEAERDTRPAPTFADSPQEPAPVAPSGSAVTAMIRDILAEELRDAPLFDRAALQEMIRTELRQALRHQIATELRSVLDSEAP